MANDIQDRIGQLLGSDSARTLAGTAVTEALKAFGGQRSSNGASEDDSRSRGGGLSGMRGLAAGAGAAAMAPLAVKGIGKLINGNGASALTEGPKKLAGEATSKLGETVEGKLKDKVEEAGGPSGILKDTVKGALPFGGGGGGGGGGKQDAEGVGKGRRMPIQQSMDIGLPIETVYNQWTQFEEWPKFMHRVTRASQEDPCKVNFAVKIWGKTKEFTADIETQRPNDRIKWKTTQGMTHSGVVVFRELGENLTRVILSFDVAPGGLLEKYARGARYVKRAARADLHRFAAFIEMLEHETGAWRGVIEDGELVEDHDPSYDEEREYGDAEELVHGRGSDEEDEDSEDDDEDEDEARGQNGGEPGQRRGRSRAQSRSSGSSRSPAARSSSGGRSSSSSRSKSSGSSSSGRTKSGGSGSSGRSKSGGSSSSARKSSGRSSSGGSSSSGRTSGSRASSSRGSGGKASSGRSSSGRGSGSSGSSSGASRSSGRSRGTSRSSRSSSAEHQGQRSRSSRRS